MQQKDLCSYGAVIKINDVTLRLKPKGFHMYSHWLNRWWFEEVEPGL
jgi:hypothetical protein